MFNLQHSLVKVFLGLGLVWGGVFGMGYINSQAKGTDPWQEIPITSIEGVRIGSVEDRQAQTGVTALIFPQGAHGGIDISGGGPASRETPLLNPLTADNPLNAVLLSGGSAYGLAASTGAMEYLRDHHMGFDTGFSLVPLVCQSCLYDLSYGSNTVYPDAKMGYAACVAAEKNEPRSGNFGAGTGATVGKVITMHQAMKSGLGFYAIQIGDLKIGAIVAVNAMGDVYDSETGKKLAGLRTADRKDFLDAQSEFYKNLKPRNLFTGNTTIGAIVTNGSFSKAELCKLASMARNGYARSIKPVGTMADGDSIYALSCGKVPADLSVTGTLAAEVMSRAIANAVTSSQIPDQEYLQNCRSLDNPKPAPKK